MGGSRRNVLIRGLFAMNKRLALRILAGAMAAALLLSLCCCGSEPSYDPKTDDSLSKVTESGRLVLGFDGAFPPMGFVDDEGVTVGFDIDVAEEVCARLGVELVTEIIDWGTKEIALNEGKVDCIWNGFSVTPARAETMCLSEDYMKNSMILVVPGDSDIQGTSDLTDKRVGLQAGSTAMDCIRTSELADKVFPVEFDTVTGVIRGLKKGEVDVILVDSTAAYYFLFSSEEQYYMLPDSLGEEDYAIAFRKNDVKLRDRIQEILREMKADGTLGRISAEWFGSDITTVR